MAGRQRVFAAGFGNTNKYKELPRNTPDRKDLRFSDFNVGLPPVALVFGFLRCNDTRNVTRGERLLSVAWRNSALVTLLPRVAIRFGFGGVASGHERSLFSCPRAASTRG
jgi:hypothetical protein